MSKIAQTPNRIGWRRPTVLALLAGAVVALVPAAQAAARFVDLRSPDARDAARALDTRVPVSPNPDEATLIAASQPAQHVSSLLVVRPNPDEIGNGPRSVSGPEFAALTRPQNAESSRSFDWGDAGIGAGAMFVLALALGGGVLAASSRRARRQRAVAA